MNNSAEPREPLRIRPRDNSPGYTSRIENHEIFRQLIAEELRSGRLNPARRRRIVRYAARMGLSAVEAGQLLSTCREEALACDDPIVREHGLRLVLPPERRPRPLIQRFAVALVAALAIHWVIRTMGQ